MFYFCIFVPVPPTPRALPVSTSVPSTPLRKRVLGPLVAEGFQEHTCIPPGPAADKERGQKSHGFGNPNPLEFGGSHDTLRSHLAQAGPSSKKDTLHTCSSGAGGGRLPRPQHACSWGAGGGSLPRTQHCILHVPWQQPRKSTTSHQLWRAVTRCVGFVKLAPPAIAPSAPMQKSRMHLIGWRFCR